MSDIFEEVDEDVRREQMNALVKMWGPYVVGMAVAIVLTVSGWIGWNSYTEGKLQDESLKFETAMIEVAAGNFEGAAKSFEALSKTSDSGYALLSELRTASNLLEIGDMSGAAKQWDSVAGKASENPRLANLAKLNAAVLLIDMGKNDEARVRLEAVSSEGLSFQYTANELLAFMDYSEGNYEAALAAYQEMAFSQNVPQGIQKRAKEMLAIVESKGVKPEPKNEDDVK